MAKSSYLDTAALCSRIVGDAKAGSFSPVYLLMGEEPYYPEKACQAIVENCVEEDLRDFNQSVFYGLDTDANAVASEARMYPMMAERRLVVLKDAQLLKNLDDLSLYLQDPMESTVLVILFRGTSADKRKAFYKAAQKKAVVMESLKLKDADIPGWIMAHFKEKGYAIDPSAAALFGEYAGVDLSKIAVETEKMLKNLPQGTTQVSVADVERNVGISREYSIFELTKELSYHNKAKALKVASRFSQTPRFAMPMAVPMLFTHFYRILRYGLLLQKTPNPSASQKAQVLTGMNPYFYREYDTAVRFYPPRKCMRIISLLEEYDGKGKGMGGCDTDAGELLMELVTWIVNI